MAVTPVYGIPYQTLADAPDGPNLGEDLALEVEAEIVRVDAAIAALDTRIDAIEDGSALFARKTADQTVTSSTVLVDCTDLSVTLATTATYDFELRLYYTSPVDNVADVKVQFVNPAGAEHTQVAEGLVTTIVGSAPYTLSQLSAVAFTAAVVAAGTTGTVQCLKITGTIRTTGTGGTCKVQFAQNTSSANGTTVKAQSTLKLERVA